MTRMKQNFSVSDSVQRRRGRPTRRHFDAVSGSCILLPILLSSLSQDPVLSPANLAVPVSLQVRISLQILSSLFPMKHRRRLSFVIPACFEKGNLGRTSICLLVKIKEACLVVKEVKVDDRRGLRLDWAPFEIGDVVAAVVVVAADLC